MNYQLSRRTFLRGAGGVTMALPWMESHQVWGDDQRSLKSARQQGDQGSTPPRRLVVLFSGNGFHSGEFWAKKSDSGLQLGQVLSPIADFSKRVTFVRGLFNEQALKGNIHSSQTGNMLSGAPLASGGAIRSGTSFDQVIAQRYGRSTRVPSLVLGCERSNPGIHKDYSMLYSSHISWSSPTNPTPLEVYPALAFDRLFNNKASRGDRSVLDAVLSEARRFRKGISLTDQRKFDEFLNSVREVETRIERAGQKGELQGWRPVLDGPNIPRPPDGIPQDLPEHMKLMCDVVVLGFLTDTTRVATLKLNNDHSYLRFPHLGIEVGHHELSHRNNAEYLKVNQFMFAQMGYIANRLQAVKEADGTALDQTMMMYCSSMMSGSHNASQLPVVLLGGGGLKEGGRILDYQGKSHRQMCSLFLSLMDKFGISLDRFGDSATRLAEI